MLTASLRPALRVGALATILAMLPLLRQAPVSAEGCDYSQYLAACDQAISGFNTFCNNWCYDEYGVAGYEDGSQCHWVGENETPEDCVEFYPESCGCFESMGGGDCVCIRW